MAKKRRSKSSAAIALGGYTLTQWANKIQHAATDIPLSVLGLNVRDLSSSDDVCSQAKILIRDFIYQRLKLYGLLSIKLELQTAPARNTDVAMEINGLANELDRMYPKLYHNISRQLNIPITSEAVAKKTLCSIADHMFKNSVVTWGRIIAMFAITGALAVELVQQNKPELVRPLVDVFSDITQKYLATWITKQGGWSDVTEAFKTANETSTLWTLTGIGAALGLLVTVLTAFGV